MTHFPTLSTLLTLQDSQRPCERVDEWVVFSARAAQIRSAVREYLLGQARGFWRLLNMRFQNGKF